MARYTNTKEISEAFIRDGWSEITWLQNKREVFMR